jgi:hypothetical protein
MPESPYVKDSEYTVNPSSYEGNSRQYLVNSLDYILSIDTYSIINDVTQYGEHFSTSEELFEEYGVTVDTYVYEPPIPRYPSWTFGQGLWAVLKVAGVVLGCISFVYSVVSGTLFALLKTVPYALLDLKDLVVGAVTKTTTLIFPRIQMLWPKFYDYIVSLATHGEKIGWMPYYEYILGEKTVSWLELGPFSACQSTIMSASSASSASSMNSFIDWVEMEKHAYRQI